MTEIPLLFLEFFKTGLFAVGGGLATIPYLMQMSQRYPHWFSAETLADMIAVSESTPGPLGINMATYVGYTVAGASGAFVSTFALILPSFIIILMIVKALKEFHSNRFVNACFKGLLPATTGLIAAAGLTILRMAIFNGESLELSLFALFLAILILTQIFNNLHPALYIGAAAVAGVVFKL